jgi:hypothetical protein
MSYTALSAAVLALACLAAAALLGRARRRYAEADQPALFCALLGLLLPAGAALCAAVPAWRAAELWLSQASALLGLPLLGATALCLGRGWQWSRPTWGRLLLGLCVFFELARRAGLLADYRLLLTLASLLLILYAGLVQWPRKAPGLAASLVAGLFVLAGLAERTARMELLYLALTPAYPLLAWLLLALPGRSIQEKPAKAL